jgi:hypothetical protein
MRPGRRLVFMTSPPCGSAMLCASTAARGCAGVCEPYMQPAFPTRKVFPPFGCGLSSTARRSQAKVRERPTGLFRWTFARSHHHSHYRAPCLAARVTKVA